MFLLNDLAVTTSENTGISLTITPESALDKDYVIRYFITGAGLHPESSGSLLLSSGSVDFVSGSTAAITTTIGRTINNLVKDYSKGVSVKVASYEVSEENGVRTEGNETVLLDDHRVTITDTKDTTIKPTHEVPSTADKDVANIGNSFDPLDITQEAGDDLFIITRHMTNHHEFKDTDGQNIIKFDFGVEITGITQSVSSSTSTPVVSESRLIFGSGGSLDITSPTGNLYQIGDNTLLSYNDFYVEVTKSGFLVAETGTLSRVYKMKEQQELYAPFQATGADIDVTGLANTITEGQSLSLTLAPSGTLSSATTVNWEIIGVGRLPISDGDITTTSGTLNFAANATSSNSQTLSITTNDNKLVDYDRQFLLKIELEGTSGTAEPLVTNYLVTITDNETPSEGTLYQPATVYDDVIVLVNSNIAVTGHAGDDILVVTRHITKDLEIVDVYGDNIIKFDEGAVITSVDEEKLQLGSILIHYKLTLGLETGAELTMAGPLRYDYQIGDGLVMNYHDFISTVTTGGFTTDDQNQDTTTLSTAFAVTKAPEASALSLSHTNITFFEGRQTAAKDLVTISSNLTGYEASVSDNRFEIDTSGTDHILRLKANTEFDYESGADLDLSIRYSKTGEEDVTASFTIHLLDVNEAPTITGVASNLALTEDAAVSTTATQTPVIMDQDAGDLVEDMIVNVQVSSSLDNDTQTVRLNEIKAISLLYGTLHFTRGQDGNVSYYYQLDNSNDSVNSLLSTQTLTDSFSFSVSNSEGVSVNAPLVNITITGHNDAPVLTHHLKSTSLDEGVYDEVADTAYSYSVADPDGSPTISVSGDDRFQLSFDNASSQYKLQIKAGSEFDYETAADKIITLTITATDNVDSTLTDTKTAVITFADINEAPTIDSGVSFIDIEADVAMSYGIASDAFADEDANDALTYTVSMADGSALPSWLSFANNQLTGTPTATDIKRYVLNVTATDKGGLTVTDKLVISRELAATALDNNSFYLGTAHSTHSDGRLVGALTVNQEANFTASLTGADASYFTLTNTNGVLSISYKDGVTDDSREVGTVYDVSLVITDSDIASRTLTINDLNIIQGREVVFSKFGRRNSGSGTAGDDVAVVPDGHASTVFAGDGNDLIYGSDFNDTIYGQMGDDIIYARGGADNVFLVSGANIVDGGAGADSLFFSSANSAIYFDLSAGTDADGFFRITAGILKDTRFKNFHLIVATNYNDVIKADDNDNEIRGELGADIIYGYGGADEIEARGGENKIYGGDGNDTLCILDANSRDMNYLYGEAGDDFLGGYTSQDYLYGGEGNDSLSGSVGNDFLYGGAGDDKLFSGEGDDYIEGGAGADRIRGETGFDTLSYANSPQAVSVVLAIVQIEDEDTIYESVGSTGGHAEGDKIGGIEHIIGSDHDDIFYAGEYAETIDGGKGNNTVSYEYSTSNEKIIVDLSADKDEDDFTTASTGGYAAGDKFKNIQNLTGAQTAPVTFKGDDQDNILTSLSHLGSTLIGGAGNDTLIGSEKSFTTSDGRVISNSTLGRDHLDGGAGNDVIDGKSGNDVIFGSAGGDKIDGGGGGDFDILTYINSNAAITMNFSEATYDDDGYVSGFTGGYVEGDKFKNIVRISASKHNDVITFSHTDESKLPDIGGFDLEGGNDQFIGSSKREEVSSGSGNDTISTHGGDDIVHLDGGDNIVYLGDGADELIITGSVVSASDTNTVYGGAGKDNLKGDVTIDYFYGDSGDDRVQGQENDDFLYGGAGDDYITNDAGDDFVDGGSGADRIILGKGIDILQGGTGTDTYELSGYSVGFLKESGQDVFTDFEQGEKIKINHVDYNSRTKFTGTTMSDVLTALATGEQEDEWKIVKGHAATGTESNDSTKQDTLIAYGVSGQSDYYIRFIFEDLDFDLSASNFEII